MISFIKKVLLEVSVSAFNDDDAIQAIYDSFGEGDFCGVEITKTEIVDRWNATFVIQTLQPGMLT